jgi:glycosyltransferase involved in cell wall biosynthesis
MDLVSVIIPTYNRSGFLVEAIQSVIAQTYRPIECIVVDDGSTDDTSIVVEEFKRQSTPGLDIYYIKQANQGAQIARNTGTRAAKGKYIQYLDSDDILYPNKFEHQVKYFSSHPDCDGVFGDWEISENGKIEKVKAHASSDLIAQFLTGRCIANFSFLMTNEMVKKIGDWDVNIKRNQEIDFHIRGLLAGAKFHYQSLDTGCWRKHDSDRINSTTGLLHILFFFKKMETMLRDSGKFDKSLSIRISNLYDWFLLQYAEEPMENRLKLIAEMLRLQTSKLLFNNRLLNYLYRSGGKKFAIRCADFFNRNK